MRTCMVLQLHCTVTLCFFSAICDQDDIESDVKCGCIRLIALNLCCAGCNWAIVAVPMR